MEEKENQGLETERYFDSQVRNTINKLFNTLYVDCKNDYGKFDKNMFLDVGNQLKEKVSHHIQLMMDTYIQL